MCKKEYIDRIKKGTALLKNIKKDFPDKYVISDEDTNNDTLKEYILCRQINHEIDESKKIVNYLCVNSTIFNRNYIAEFLNEEIF